MNATTSSSPSTASSTLSSNPAAFEKLREVIDDIDFAMVTTVADGALRSRPMSARKMDADGTLWFFTADDSAKAREIAVEHRVNVSFSDPKHQNYVSISGTATIERDPAKLRELWHPLVKAWFPQGLDDPRLALLRVNVQFADYWDSPGNKMVQLFGYAKAILSGETPKNLGHQTHVDLPSFRKKN